MTRLHFDLSHCDDADDLVLELQGAAAGLLRHGTESRLRATEDHPVLAMMPAEQVDRFTHFAEIDDAALPRDALSLQWLRVVRPAAEGVHLSEVVLMAHYLPERHLRAHARRTLSLRQHSIESLRSFYRADIQGAPRLPSGKLAALGVEDLPADPDAWEQLLVDAQTLVGPGDTAAALAAFHPELASTDPYASTVVLHDHVYPDPAVDPGQYNAVTALAHAIAAAGPAWSPVIPCKDKDGNPIHADYALGDIEAGQQLYTFGLRDDVQSLSVPVTSGARRTASDDLRLASKTWTPTPGTATVSRDSSADSAPLAVTAAQSFKWTVSEPTVHHGVSVATDSIKLQPDGTFSINASNCYARTLYAGYRRLDDAGKPIGATTRLTSISATNSIMGIPCPTDPTVLQFQLGDAASVELLFGSLGVSDWDPDVSLDGLLLTCLWQYGVPLFFIALGQAVTSTELFNKIVNDPDLTAAALAVAFGIVGGTVPTALALLNTKFVLLSFADVVISFIVKKGMEKLGAWLVEQAAEGAIKSAFGPVGWAMRLAAVALNVQSMAITTAECLSSPAGIKVKVSRAIDVGLTLAPDPRHGEAGDPTTAVWPSVATNYVVTLQLQHGGTPHQEIGKLPRTTSHDPLRIAFKDVPAGGKVRIIAGVYSDNGWLAGAWESDWLDAVPTDGTTLELGTKTITEKLVPLAGDTQYVFKERLAVTNDSYVWQAGTAPTTTRTALDCTGPSSVCDLVGITINNSAQQVGYAWRASGQHLHPDHADAPLSDDQLFAVQNLSVLAEPSSRLKSTAIGFTDRPAIAYAPSTNAGSEIDQTNFIVDPRDGDMHLRQVVLGDGKRDFGLGDPDLSSWGHFPLENVDAATVHPAGAVIAASWQKQKLMLLQLPAASSRDKDAPLALMVSGEGLRQGLLQGPKALAAAPDGRVLVLESVNRRVQAFDTKGNPVPSFTPGPSIAALRTDSIAAHLDAGKVAPSLQDTLQETGDLQRCTVPAAFAAELDSGHFTADGDLLKTLSTQGVALAYDKKAMSDPALSAQIEVVTAGAAWLITDPRGQRYHVAKTSAAELTVYLGLDDAQVTVQQGGERWLIVDKTVGSAWQLSPALNSPGSTEIRRALSFFPLRGMRTRQVTFVDMAVEAQGFVYVLAYQNDGSAATDYLLDIYAPSGAFVSRTPDPSVTRDPCNVVAGKLTVGLFRDLYGLTFETLRAPKGTPQPGLGHWMPTPPLFTLPLTSQPHFADRNISLVQKDFADHKVVLSSAAFVSVDDPDGAWTVRDAQAIYHVYRSGDGLQVYLVPA